jgi:tRNA threonylcarbamoyladenosine biosynthesis protein TsaB
MIILALDTSGPSAGVAVMRDGELVYEATVINALTHSVNIMPMVEEALLRSGLTIDDVTLFAAVVGPGSFTGVRIGVSTVKAMAQALNKPCIGVNALEALACGLAQTPHLVCPIRDARVQQVYGAVFQDGHRLMEDAVLKLPDYLNAIQALGHQFCFIGDGVPPLRDEIIRTLGDRAGFAPAHLNQLKAGAAASIAWMNRAQAGDSQALLPLYLRAPQAERERQKKHG